MDGPAIGKLLWRPADPRSSRTFEFLRAIEEEHHVCLSDYEALRTWSIQNPNDFWERVWHFTGIRASRPFERALDEDLAMFPRPAFFKNARLNFAENLLYPAAEPNEDSIAIFEANEEARESVTWRQLRERVKGCAAAMQHSGVRVGDRVAGFVANHSNALVAMLATTAIGAIWTAISPDTGVRAVLDRIQQIDPIVLVADNAVMYNGKVHDLQDKVEQIITHLPRLQAAVMFETRQVGGLDAEELRQSTPILHWYSQYVAAVSEDTRLEFAQLPADHPIYILYSSGTTGNPKCIVHGAIGTLVEHKKEHDIQCSMRAGDRLFYFTTCTWMMWHWLVSALATGVTLVLYDGSPFRPLEADGNGELAMPKLIAELGITHFGTSAKYLSLLEQKDVKINEAVDMSKLKAIYSTGSPLAPSTFEYVYRRFGPDINLASISGGTDIISCFGIASQISPVYAGEIQVRGLGMAVEAWDYQGRDLSKTGEPGDLVCVKAFPCQPVQFWGADGEAKYRMSYFERFPGVWHHGDFIRINPASGGLVMLGRSDGVLKPAGVRFGSSEIYNVLLEHFQEVEDSVCVGRRRETDVDEVVVLFLKMAPENGFSEAVVKKVKQVIREELSARHVPGIVEETPEIPVTINGKKVEIAVKQILCGTNVKTSASVANPECLEWYQQWSVNHPD